MLERPIVHCNKCRGLSVKLISGTPHFCGVDGTAQMYNFVDHNTTGKPIVINSKTQWKNHLKAHGLNDDCKNDPLTKSDVDSMERREVNKKIENRKKIKNDVIDVVKNTSLSKLRQRGINATKKRG